MQGIQNWPVFSLMMVLHCIIGSVAALVARRKGLNFGLWLVLGWIGGTVALIAACLAKGEKGNW